MAIYTKNIEDFKKYFLDGYVVSYPTETVFGIGADPTNKDAVEYLNKVKNRKDGKPYILLVKDIDMLSRYAQVDKHLKLLELVWPGPVSVVLNTKDTVPEWIDMGKKKVSFRTSSAKFISEVFKFIDRPIITTSANPEGFTIANTPTEIMAYFNEFEKVAIFPDTYDDITSHVPSTIVDLTIEPPKILRKGAYNIVF
jgi:L-threonylcarbamoyladenylate synthase